MIALIGTIEASIKDYETSGYRKIYTHDYKFVVDKFLEFWKATLEELSNVEPLNLNNFFYDKISEFLISLNPFFGKNLEESAQNIKALFNICTNHIINQNTDTYLNRKINIFYSYFVETITELSEDNAFIDSSKTLRIVDFYSESSLSKSVEGFKNYTSEKYLNIKRFKDIYKNKVLDKINQLSSNIQDLNKSIADSHLENKDMRIWDVPEDVISQTWGGEGKKIAIDLKNIKSALDDFGASEKSISGDLETISEIAKIMNLVCLSTENGIYKLDRVSGRALFGQFYTLYSARKVPTKIYGLKFLEPFLNLKSFNTINPTKAPFSNKIIQKFYNGLEMKNNVKLAYTDDTSLDSIFDVIRIGFLNLLDESQKLKGLLFNVAGSLKQNGELSNYAGLGNIKYPILMMKSVAEELVNSFNYFANGLFDLVANVNQSSFNNGFIESLLPFFIKIQRSIDSLVSTLEITGVEESQLIANINANLSKKTKRDVVEYLRKNNFPIDQIEFITEAQSFNQILNEYGDLFIDSQDLKSFFKVYELVEYLYLIDGPSAIYSLLDYINAPNLSNIRKIYVYLERNLSKYEHIDRFKLGKLVGSLLHINRATNYSSFVSYASILKAKNSDIFNSLKILDTLQVDPLKQPQELDIINEFINQLNSSSHEYVLGDIGCEEALKRAPLVVKNWIGLFDSALGSANKSLLLGFLNDNYGITIQELETYFRTSQNKGLTTLGGIISGVYGGEFTKLTEHIILSGSLVTISPHSSMRFKVEDPIYLKELTNILRNISKLMGLLYNRFIIGFDNNNTRIKSRNYEFLASRSLGDSSKYFSDDLEETLESTLPVLPPGLGGSPTKYDILTDYITPENVVLPQSLSNLNQATYTSPSFVPNQSDVGRNFIKSDFYNEVSNNIEQKLGLVPFYSKFSTTLNYSEISVDSGLFQPYEFREKYLKNKVKELVGENGWSTEPTNSQSLYEICLSTKDSNNNCEQYIDEKMIAYEPRNGYIPIQRKLYSIPELNPSEVFIQNSYKRVPAYYNILIGGETLVSGAQGNPISDSNIIEDIENSNIGLRLDYSHTHKALFEFHKSLKHNISSISHCLEFESDIVEYTKCVNYIRCYKNPQKYKFCI